MTIFLHPAGPLMKYEHGVLFIEDLNPEMKTKWRMSRAAGRLGVYSRRI
jgi:hypothetical protein